MASRTLLVIDLRPRESGHALKGRHSGSRDPGPELGQGMGTQVIGMLSQTVPPVRVLMADRADAAADLVRMQRPTVALLPVTPPDGADLAVLTRLLSEAPVLKVIALVPPDHRVLAVRAVARGAYEVCRLPPDDGELTLVVDRAFRRAELELEVRKLESGDAPPTLRTLREVTERRALLEALARSGGNLSATARELGVSRPTLYSLLRQHGIRTE